MSAVDLRRDVELPVDPDQMVRGELVLPEPAIGTVVFAHGSGSSRHSARNRQVAATFNRRGIATLLMDLLTDDEDTVDRATAEHRFDIDLLTDRVVAALGWVHEGDVCADSLGVFGASTGAAAALRAAARVPEWVSAVVSRGGRPDLAGPDALAEVRAPTLLIIGARDTHVLRLNEEAAAVLRAPYEIAIVPRATHLFEEPGTLQEVARLAAGWFTTQLSTTAR